MKNLVYVLMKLFVMNNYEELIEESDEELTETKGLKKKMKILKN